VVDKAKLYKLQQRIRWADDHDARDRKNLAKHRGVTAAPCSAVGVQNVIACRRAGNYDDRIAKILSSFVADYEENVQRE